MRMCRRLFSVGLPMAAVLFAWGARAFAVAGGPPTRVARLAQIAAQVSLEPAGTDQWTAAVPNTPLTNGDRLYVNRQGHAELQMGQMGVRAWKYTDVTVANLSNDTTQLALAQGSLHVRTFLLGPKSNVEVDTPNGAITAMQPGDFRLDVYTSDGGTLVTVDSGEIQIRGPGLAKVLGAGQCAHLVGSNPIHVLTQPMPGKDPFDVWSLQRDRAFLSSQSRQHVNPYTVGFDDLDRYGTWKQTLEYGPVWYPSEVPAGWSPYSTGRWAWVAPWGWTWVDADAWGFAPFHYGRWTDLGSRWGWVPGPLGSVPIYSPAMVAFVGGAKFSGEGGAPLAGWFPLGPGEPFYPSYSCSASCFTEVNLTNIGEARSAPRYVTAANYFRYYHTQAGFRSIRYAHEKTATIAVPSNELAAGGAIAPGTAIHPDAQQWMLARVLSHPMVAPTLQSLVPVPVAAVPVPAERPPVIVALRPEVTTQPPSALAGSSQAQPDEGFRLIARTPPPAARPAFAQQLPGLSQDPGRPLDVGQMNNLAQGRPAGPANARDFPPPTSLSPRAGVRRAGRK
ncbi:MAG: DUF6600 domain-containing protein [Acidobacteriaceae bacterium]